MPIRTTRTDYTYKPPGKKLQAKIKNFLINSGLIDRRGLVYDHNTTITFDYTNKGRANFTIRNKGEFVASYSATVRRVRKHVTFRYVEKYNTPYVNLMKAWVENMAKMMPAEEQEENPSVV